MDSFGENIRWNLKQIAVQAGHAEQVNGRAKSGYYKAAIIMAASVVEALAYKILEQNRDLDMPLGDWECKNSCDLPSRYKSADGNKLSICERHKPVFRLDKHTDFKKVNNICFKLGIFSKAFYAKIERVRELRNKIHIQGLDNLDRSYTRGELEFVSSVLGELLEKLAK